ncbi:MAG TPA: hypothetical protein DIT05_14055 [Morganella sp. (in: Bacteria)]|nr:hypothetical protein [Morganella sp. (in: enterobacteria)]
MEITPDQKRAICTILVEQAGRRVRNTELTALCDDDTITAALDFLTRLIEIKHSEIAATQATELAELQSQNPQMVMGSLLSGSTLSALNKETAETEPAVPEIEVSDTPAEENIKDNTEETEDEIAAKVADHIAAIFGDKSLFPEFAEPTETQDPLKNHSWLFEDTESDDAVLPPFGVFSEPTEKQDEIIEQQEATPEETISEPVKDTVAVTEAEDKPAQPAAAVLNDIFSFTGAPSVPQSEPVNTPVIPEAAQSETPADTVTIPVEESAEESAEENTEETAEEMSAKAADHIAAIFGDKSLFPEFAEPTETQDPLKNHSWLFEDTESDDAVLPPFGVFSEPTEKRDAITEQPEQEATPEETISEPVKDTVPVTEAEDKPAQPAAAVLNDIFSFIGAPSVPQSEPVNTPVIPEAAQSESLSAQEITSHDIPADTVTIPVEDHTEEAAEEAAEDTAAKVADHIASIFGDKSLFPEFPEPTEKHDQLKNHSWLFEDLDTDDSDIPAIGDLSADGSHTTQDTLRSGAWLFDEPDTGTHAQNTPSTEVPVTPVQPEPAGTTLFNSLPPTTKQQDNDLLAENWLFADDTDAADPKPWGLAALLAAGKSSGNNEDKPTATPAGPVFKDVTKDSKSVTAPENEPGSEHIHLPPADPADIITTHSDAQANPLMPLAPQAPARPTIRIEVARARQNEPFNSPVTAMLHDGRQVTVLGIYFQSSIGLNFNERTSTLYGKPTESGEFSLRVVWELAPKRRFSTDVTFVVSPDPHCPPLPEIYASPAE